LAIRIIEFALFVKTYFLPGHSKTDENGDGVFASGLPERFRPASL